MSRDILRRVLETVTPQRTQRKREERFTRAVVKVIRQFRDSQEPPPVPAARADSINQTTRAIIALSGFIERKKVGKRDWQQGILDEVREETVIVMGRSCHCD